MVILEKKKEKIEPLVYTNNTHIMTWQMNLLSLSFFFFFDINLYMPDGYDWPCFWVLVNGDASSVNMRSPIFFFWIILIAISTSALQNEIHGPLLYSDDMSCCIFAGMYHRSKANTAVTGMQSLHDPRDTDTQRSVKK